LITEQVETITLKNSNVLSFKPWGGIVVSTNVNTVLRQTRLKSATKVIEIFRDQI